MNDLIKNKKIYSPNTPYQQFENGYNVLDYGLTGNGTTDDRTALNTLVNTTAPDGATIYFPPGQYLIGSSITVTNKRLNFVGVGLSSIIKTTANTQMFVLSSTGSTSNNWKFDSIRFQGSGAGANQYAVYLSAQAGDFLFNNCYFESLAGGGIAVGTTNVSTYLGGTISNCTFKSNGTAIDLFSLSEYIRIINNQFVSNTRAIQTVSGNAIIDGNNITYNNIGIRIASGSNNGHGIVSNNNINHNTGDGLNIGNVALGMTFIGNHIYQNNITIATCSGIRFIGGQIDVGAYSFTNATATRFVDVSFPNSYSNTITLVSGEAPQFINCEYLTGKSFNYPTVSTTNATVTTLATIICPVTTTTSIVGYVSARRTGGTAGTAEDGALYRVEAVVKNVAGTATIIGSTVTVIGEDQAGWDVTLAGSSGNILIQVTGAVNNNINWTWTGKLTTIS